MILKIIFTLTAFTSLWMDFPKNGLLFTAAIPVKGIGECLNNQDCVGAHRFCFRNQSMQVGQCTCKEGYKAAQGHLIKCLNIMKNECETEEDCPNRGPCISPLGYASNMELLLDDVNLSFGSDSNKRCFFDFGNIIEPRLGGGLRQGPDFLDNLYSLGSHRHRHQTDLSGEYIKFVEDAMLVLFLLCILITLMMVHRATCRNFILSHRNGPLRFIIPQRDDQPPPYGNYEVAVVNRVGHVDVTDSPQPGPGLTTEAIQQSGKAESRAETPPPTYDEALSVSHSVRLSDETRTTATNQPLFIALPDPQTESNLQTQVDNSNQNEHPVGGEDDDQPPSYTAISCPDVVET